MKITLTLDIPNGIYHYTKVLYEDDNTLKIASHFQELLDYINQQYLKRLVKNSSLQFFKDLEPRFITTMTATMEIDNYASTASILLDVPEYVMEANIYATFLGYSTQVQWDSYLDRILVFLRLLGEPV